MNEKSPGLNRFEFLSGEYWPENFFKLKTQLWNSYVIFLLEKRRTPTVHTGRTDDLKLKKCWVTILQFKKTAL